MNRTHIIDTLKKILAGQATPEDLKEKKMVMKIIVARQGSPARGRSGLYVNGKLSTDPKDLEEFERTSKNDTKIIVTRYDPDDEQEGDSPGA